MFDTDGLHGCTVPVCVPVCVSVITGRRWRDTVVQ